MFKDKKIMLKIIAMIIIIFLLGSLSGCSNLYKAIITPSRLSKEGQKKAHYISIGVPYMEGYLFEKYGEKLTVENVRVPEFKPRWLYACTYMPMVCGDVETNGKTYEVCVEIGETLVAYDNIQKEEILRDFNEYFSDIVDSEAYYTAIMLPENAIPNYNYYVPDDFMINEYYDGNIADFYVNCNHSWCKDNKHPVKMMALYRDADFDKLPADITNSHMFSNVILAITPDRELNQDESTAVLKSGIKSYCLPYISELWIKYNGDYASDSYISHRNINMTEFGDILYYTDEPNTTITSTPNPPQEILDAVANEITIDLDDYKFVTDWYYMNTGKIDPEIDDGIDGEIDGADPGVGIYIYGCDFDAPLIGIYYKSQLGRYRVISVDPNDYKVYDDFLGKSGDDMDYFGTTYRFKERWFVICAIV